MFGWLEQKTLLKFSVAALKSEKKTQNPKRRQTMIAFFAFYFFQTVLALEACSLNELAKFDAAAASMCAETSDPCHGTACAVYVAKNLDFSPNCIGQYQKLCKDFVRRVCFLNFTRA